MSAAASLADAWEQYAAENLPAGCDPLAVVMMRRCWYTSAATVLKMTEGKATREQMLAEIVLFGRTVGREVELTSSR